MRTGLLSIDNEELIDQLFPKYSMVVPSSMQITIQAAEAYYKNRGGKGDDDEGVVVECGVWRGGMSVLLAKLFPTKSLYLCDSFVGFEPIGASPYSLPLAKNPEGPAAGGERHYPEKPLVWQGEQASWRVSKEQVEQNLADFGLVPELHGIKFVPGFIRDSLPPILGELDKISCLRIDVDAYAATYECLKMLYDKVEDGGIIIFDDYKEVEEATSAIHAFETERALHFDFLPDRCLGCYIVKKDKREAC